MEKYNIWKFVSIILLTSLLFLIGNSVIKSYFRIPQSIMMFQGQSVSVPKDFPVMKSSQKSGNNIISTDDLSNKIAVKGRTAGKTDLYIKMAGIPIKRVDVNVLKDFKVIPGGQSIGVKLHTKGVLVVGHHLVATKEGKKSPGEIAGVRIGDTILKINNKNITKMSDVTPFIQSAGKTGEKLQLKIMRNKKTFDTQIQPLRDEGGVTYRIGLYIRDSAAGIGTMTFYDPISLKYGALGHVISDMDTKKPIIARDGVVVRSSVTSIEKGTRGNPGEKLARFSSDENIIGSISNNTPFGIFGTLHSSISNNFQKKALPISLSSEVKVGPAKILTVLHDDIVESFNIEIKEVTKQKFPSIKGMVIKITDSRLLEETGGIVQGMSGSPIIQDGKLIGAVTHVFVNDPTSGYGVHIEWMLHDAGIDIYNQTSKAS